MCCSYEQSGCRVVMLSVALSLIHFREGWGGGNPEPLIGFFDYKNIRLYIIEYIPLDRRFLYLLNRELSCVPQVISN